MNQYGPSLISQNFLTYYFYILHIVETIFKCLWGLETYVQNVYEFC